MYGCDRTDMLVELGKIQGKLDKKRLEKEKLLEETQRKVDLIQKEREQLRELRKNIMDVIAR